MKRTIGFAYYAAPNKNTTDKFIVVNHQGLVVRHAYIQVADVMLNVCSTSLHTVKRDKTANVLLLWFSATVLLTLCTH